MRIPLLRGRVFTQSDREGTARTVIINETAARQSFPNEDPVGKHLSMDIGDAHPTWLQVVGVVKDVRHDGLDLPVQQTIYFPMLQNPSGFMAMVVRTAVDPLSLSAAIRGAIASVDKDQPVFLVRTMEQIYSDSVAQPRFNMVLLDTFGLLALTLAVFGIYGVMSYAVTQRTHEIGVRIALGAQQGDVLKIVLGQSLRLTLAGVTFGLVGAFGLTRFLSRLLFDVGTTDPVTFVGVSLFLTGVALLASYIPARRAAKVDPMVALRYE